MFKLYQGRPVQREAHCVEASDLITPVPGKDSTSLLRATDSQLEFKHYEPVNVGDYIVFLTDSDVYHCTKEVFEERNHVGDVEEQIQDAGLLAPRVTPAHIQQLMAKVEYKRHLVPGTTTTQVTAMLDGFSLAIGVSACVDPANFNEQIGNNIAADNAKRQAEEQLWLLEGYKLKFS